MKYEDGIHDISNEEYHSSKGFSRSQIMLMDKSPYHFWYSAVSGLASKKQETSSLNIGGAFHLMLLQPGLFDNEFIVKPKVDKLTKEVRLKDVGREEFDRVNQAREAQSLVNKHILDIFERNAQGKTVLTQDQYNMIYSMVFHVKQHEIVDTLIGEAQFERSIFWTDKETGLQFKCRPDIWSNKMIVDLKTTKDANPRMYVNSAYRYGYYLQCGMFFEACEAIGRPIEMFVHLTIEKEEPYVPAVFVMDEKAVEFGREQFNAYKRKIKECMENGKWPGYKVQEISVPKYATIDEE